MFGEVVRAHRRRLGLTQEELADRSGLSVRSIGKIESSRIVAPRPPTVRLLADAFGLTGADRDRFCQSVTDGTTAEPASGIMPAQLPSDVFGFTGRRGELACLDTLLAASTGAVPSAVVISAVCGTAGVGKPNPEN
jgi:transcriptional regulator with XRE-family HTH domain